MSAASSEPRRLRPTDLLRREHRQIEERLGVLAAALEELGSRGPDPVVLDRIEEVARYIDAEMSVHHRKEEEGLFPLLARHIDEELHLDSRVADHEDLRVMNAKFKEALEECRRPTGDPFFAAQMLKGYGLYIVHLVLEHLLKEDQILFLVAEHFLTEAQEEEVFQRFRRIEAAR